uniref:Uncharacterized protein n=1 Tax=Arundo donax TaxID=35708 RepID=A0A0A8Y6B8_ARUDO
MQLSTCSFKSAVREPSFVSPEIYFSHKMYCTVQTPSTFSFAK